MFDLPLHPALVHLPLGLSLILPMLALAAAVQWARLHKPGALWWATVALQAVVLLGALAAENTGEEDAEQVERVVAESAIEEHEELAESFVTLSGGLLVAMGLISLVGRRPAGPWLAGAATAGLLGATGLGIAVGHAGGQLIYRHGAAQVHIQAAQNQTAQSTAEGASAALSAILGGGSESDEGDEGDEDDDD